MKKKKTKLGRPAISDGTKKVRTIIFIEERILDKFTVSGCKKFAENSINAAYWRNESKLPGVETAKPQV